MVDVCVCVNEQKIYRCKKPPEMRKRSIYHVWRRGRLETGRKTRYYDSQYSRKWIFCNKRVHETTTDVSEEDLGTEEGKKLEIERTYKYCFFVS